MSNAPIEATRDKRILDLAALDWAGKNPKYIAPYNDLTAHTLSVYRASDLYKETISDLKAESLEVMLKLPQTHQLKKRIAHAMNLSIELVIEILTKPGDEKDKLAAARLAAQWDGRFLHGDADDADNPAKTDSVANEILTALKRHQETIQ